MTRKPWTLVLFVAAVVGLSAFGGWRAWTSAVVRDVSVAWSQASPACEGTEVKRAGSRRPVIEAREGMRCVITVTVAHASRRTVHVPEAVAPVVGPDTGAVVTAVNDESEDWPTVTVDVLGRSFRVQGDRDFAFHRSRRTPGCTSLR